MSQTPSVSIVMPVYNAREFIEAALASVFAQTHSDWELILVDDASTDGTWEYLQRLDDPRVRLYRNDRNRKHPETVNRAIDLARGKWIARMDGDDVILPQRLERQVAALEADPEVDVLGTGVFSTDKELNLVSVVRAPAEHDQIAKWPSLSMRLCYGSLVGKAQWWKRWKVEPRALYSTSFDLFFRSYRESVYGNVPDPLYIYRYVGHTRNMKKLTLAMHCRAMTYFRHGFRRGEVLSTLLGLASLVPRPLLYLIKFAVGSKTGLASGRQAQPSPKDLQAFREGLEAAAGMKVPLKAASEDKGSEPATDHLRSQLNSLQPEDMSLLSRESRTSNES